MLRQMHGLLFCMQVNLQDLLVSAVPGSFLAGPEPDLDLVGFWYGGQALSPLTLLHVNLRNKNTIIKRSSDSTETIFRLRFWFWFGFRSRSDVLRGFPASSSRARLGGVTDQLRFFTLILLFFLLWLLGSISAPQPLLPHLYPGKPGEQRAAAPPAGRVRERTCLWCVQCLSGTFSSRILQVSAPSRKKKNRSLTWASLSRPPGGTLLINGVEVSVGGRWLQQEVVIGLDSDASSCSVSSSIMANEVYAATTVSNPKAPFWLGAASEHLNMPRFALKILEVVRSKFTRL
ncbi:hypothetical protein CCH79_00019779 [Gambusia affinis]|uniref:Uncharacterized protein n=1 Tax=Gambusia affinis TaxID=33528 RepID=A0A315VCP4_GAMAF|nr:hypothetical protein CCH79_00019779 [Gambusia affinis]